MRLGVIQGGLWTPLLCRLRSRSTPFRFRPRCAPSRGANELLRDMLDHSPASTSPQETWVIRPEGELRQEFVANQRTLGTAESWYVLKAHALEHSRQMRVVPARKEHDSPRSNHREFEWKEVEGVA